MSNVVWLFLWLHSVWSSPSLIFVLCMYSFLTRSRGNVHSSSSSICSVNSLWVITSLFQFFYSPIILLSSFFWWSTASFCVLSKRPWWCVWISILVFRFYCSTWGFVINSCLSESDVFFYDCTSHSAYSNTLQYIQYHCSNYMCALCKLIIQSPLGLCNMIQISYFNTGNFISIQHYISSVHNKYLQNPCFF